MTSNLNYEILARVPAFQGLSGSEIAALAGISAKVQVDSGQFVLREGSLADCFFLLCSGGMEVLLEQAGRQTPIAQLGPGQLIGEMPLVYKQPIRQASVVAMANSSLLRFDYAECEKLCALHPELGKKLWLNLGRIAESRYFASSDEPPILSLLRECRIFQGLEAAGLERIASIALPTEAETGTVVVRIDEPADSFFFVVSGQVEVQVTRDGLVQPLTRLGRGQIFGEMPLIYQQPMRFASVVAIEPVRLLLFPFSAFQDLMDRFPNLGRGIAANLLRLAASRSGVIEGH